MKNYLFALLFLLFVAPAIAQTSKFFTVKGQVTDSLTGKPLEYSTVAICLPNNTSEMLQGQVADEKGNFEIKAIKRNTVLIISHLGYKTFIKNLTAEIENETDLGQIKIAQQANTLETAVIKPLV